MATLPDTITVTNVAVDSSTVYGISSRSSNRTEYEAPSSQSDLEGQPTAVVTSKTTANKVEVGNVMTEEPRYDSTAGEYTGSDKITTVFLRKTTGSVIDTQNAIEKHASFLTQNAEELAKSAQ